VFDPHFASPVLVHTTTGASSVRRNLADKKSTGMNGNEHSIELLKTIHAV
jgi:hypothetical protein